MKRNNFKEFISLLEQLHKEYPTYSIGRHLSTAFDDYGDLFDVTDREMCFALEKYLSTLEMDNQVVSDEYVYRIIEDGKHLLDFTEDEEE